jgi:hypothetical protein
MEMSWNRWCFSGAESGISTMGSLGWAMRTPGMALRPQTSRAQACLRGRCISGEAKYRAKLRASRPGRRLLAHRKLPLRSAALSTLDVLRRGEASRARRCCCCCLRSKPPSPTFHFLESLDAALLNGRLFYINPIRPSPSRRAQQVSRGGTRRCAMIFRCIPA